MRSIGDVEAIRTAIEERRLLHRSTKARGQSKRLHERLPVAALRIVPGAGHMVHHTATSAVMDAVNDAHEMSKQKTTVRQGVEARTPLASTDDAPTQPIPKLDEVEPGAHATAEEELFAR